MRTLKKVLALTLALATLFSLTAFAAYKDESKIDPDVMSAVNLVSSLKIMMGDENGFRPTDTIKRSEAAKMVYVLRTGGKTEADGWKGQNLFTDMKGHWAEGYVNYCASVGIIAGVGNKKFNPNGNVTGVELAKMLLVAAGYKADLQGYAGTQWANKVLADAESVGMFDGYNAAYMAAAPRQYAAQMFANALLRTNMAVYLSGELVTGIVANPVLVGAKYFGLATQTGELATVGKNFTLTGASALPSGVETPKAANFAAPAELRYQDVKVVFNGKTGEIYDMYASGKSKVFNVQASDVKLTLVTAKGLSATEEYTLELPGYSKTTYKAGAVNTDIALTTYATSSAAIDDTMAALKTIVDTKTNDTIRFIDTNGDGKFETVVRFDATYGIVDKNSANDGFTTTGNVVTVSKDDYSKINFMDTVAKNDYVKTYLDLAGVRVVAKAASVIGIATSVSNGVYNVGGTKYELSAQKIGSPTITLGTEYKFITDGKYVIATTSASETTVVNEFSKDICLVLATNYTDYAASTDLNPVSPRVQVLLSTGETKIYEWGGKKSDLETINTGLTATEKKVMQYTLKDGKLLLAAVTDPDGVSGPAFVTGGTSKFGFTKSTNAFTYNSAAVKVTADTFFFVQAADGKFAVVKASELKGDLLDKDTAGMASTVKNGITTLAFGYIKATAPGAAVSNTYAIVNGVLGQKWDAEAKTNVHFIPAVDMNGNEIEIILAAGTVDPNMVWVGGLEVATVNKGIYKVTTEDGKSKLTAVTTAGDYVKAATVAGFDDSSLAVGTSFIPFATGHKVVFVDKTTFAVKTGVELVINDTVDYVMNGDNQITTLIVLK